MRFLTVMMFVAIAAAGVFGQGTDRAVTSGSVLDLEHAAAATFESGQYELAAVQAKELLAVAPEIQSVSVRISSTLRTADNASPDPSSWSAPRAVGYAPRFGPPSSWNASLDQVR